MSQFSGYFQQLKRLSSINYALAREAIFKITPKDTPRHEIDEYFRTLCGADCCAIFKLHSKINRKFFFIII